MSVNVVVISGILSSMALKYDSAGKPELRFTLAQSDPGREWINYWPCYAISNTAERLAETLHDGQHIIVTRAQLAYRKRTTKSGEVNRAEILCWAVEAVDKGSESRPGDTSPPSESHRYGDTATRGGEAAAGRPQQAKPRPWVRSSSAT